MPNNELIFVNNLKMKISVIIAIIHSLKCYNALYFKRTMEIMIDAGLKVGRTIYNSLLTQENSFAMWGDAGVSSQDSIQVIIHLIALLSMPMMPLSKPLIKIDRKKRHRPHEQELLGRRVRERARSKG